MVEWLPADDKTPSLSCSVGIMAYNEAGNIGNAIATILQQRPAHGHVAEVIVVASGCTDETVPIVTDIARCDPRVRLTVQERREGKASAINVFLGEARSPILLLVSADVLLKDGTLDLLLAPFHDPQVGMVGAHPIPVNDEATFLGHAVHLVWKLHDQVARHMPKLGEAVAFRNVVPSIPRDTPVDEISIQALISQLGYRLVYEPRAIVYNRGPATIGDFLRQRRRIYAGHLKIQQQQGYTAATMNLARIARALFATDALTDPDAALRTLGAVGLEALARSLGTYDHLRRRPNHVWQMATTTKRYIAEEVNAYGQQSVLVFHIVGFHQLELDLGARASQLLIEQVRQRVQQQLGPIAGSLVSVRRAGTIIAFLPTAREEAEQVAASLAQAIGSAPIRVNGHRDGIPVKLAYGIIEVAQAEAAQAEAAGTTAAPATGAASAAI